MNTRIKTHNRYHMNCPYGVGLLLRIHCRADSFDEEYPPSPLRLGILRELQGNGLIEASSQFETGWQTTMKGRAHIQQLCHLTFPHKGEQPWIGANGHEIKL